MRSARETYHVPPTRYLRLPWPEFGETDHLLNLAMDTLDALRCPCGCGQFIDDAHDPATEGRWQVHVQECYADKTKREFRKDHADEVEGKLLWVELLPEGKSPSDPLAFNPERAKAEFEALQKRHGVG